MEQKGKFYKPVVSQILNANKPGTILDAPSGNGWLGQSLTYDSFSIDGIDLWESKPSRYRNFYVQNLDEGLKDDLPAYQAIITCEGIEHIGNPELFIRSIFNHLDENGLVVITTPNIWYPESRLQYFIRGFFPSFPCLVSKIKRGTHMHVMPWSFAQLYLYLKLCGFEDITLHKTPERKPKHVFEWIVGILPSLYCISKKLKAKTNEQKSFWGFACSKESLYGRQLVVSAKKPGTN